MNTDTTERLLFTYSAQVLLAIILSFLFYYYYKNYNRSFLRLWSLSWIFYAILYISSALLFVIISDFRALASFAAVSSTYLQLLFMILGLQEYINGKRISSSDIFSSCLVVILFSLGTYFLYDADPSASNLRYILRVGIKSTIVGLGFLWLVFKILVSKAFYNSMSKTFMVIAFILYALQQLWHSSIVYLNASGHKVPFPI